MKRMLLLLMMITLVVPTGVLLAQTAPNTVAEVHLTKPKEGMQAKFEAGRKSRMAWHKAQNDPWAWLTWEIVTGPNTGSFLIISPSHVWKDFDGRESFDQADDKDVERATGGMVDQTVMSYWVLRGDLSRNPSLAAPSKYMTAARYWVDPTMVTEFTDGIKKINAGVDKTNYPMKPSRWAVLANGGDGPQFIVQTDRASYADMAPNDKSIDDMMGEAYGKQEGAAIMASFRKAIKRIQSEMRVYRADLSYMPSK